MGQPIQSQLEAAEQLRAKGDAAAAMSICREILEQSPQNAGALHLMGLIARQLGDAGLAMKFIEAALAADPSFATGWYNRGVMLRAQGRNGEALHCVRAAAELAPETGEAWDMTGQILKEQGDRDGALACHARAVRLQPDNPHFLGNYALALSAGGDLTGAYRAARRAAACDPAYPPVILGNIVKAMGHPALAAEYFARARILSPALAGISVNEAMARLQTGDMEEGWALWETRAESASPLNVVPVWRGQKVARLLLREDHGLGDAIQYLRYIRLLRPYAERIELSVRAPLHRLCAENFPDASLVAEDASFSSADARCRWSSLPRFFKTRLDSIPPAPYLTPSAERQGLWRAKLADLPAPRIGLIWAGNRNFLNDYKRSIAVDLLQPLLACGRAHFVSLQKDRAEKAAEIFDAAPFLEDFSDTAALIAELDLVITVDTATAHLAGALGKPVWILLPFDADWRWLLGREDSPWYLSARLFRQNAPRDWAGVVEKVAAEARKFIAGDSTVLVPARWRGANLRQDPHAIALPLQE